LLAPAFAERAAKLAFERAGERGAVESHEASDPTPVRADQEPHLGEWLVQNLAGLGEIELPPRHGRLDPFEGWED
jgi:hypothetical protein